MALEHDGRRAEALVAYAQAVAVAENETAEVVEIAEAVGIETDEEG